MRASSALVFLAAGFVAATTGAESSTGVSSDVTTPEVDTHTPTSVSVILSTGVASAGTSVPYGANATTTASSKSSATGATTKVTLTSTEDETSTTASSQSTSTGVINQNSAPANAPFNIAFVAVAGVAFAFL